MNECAARGLPGFMSLDAGLEQEFEERLRESSTLAFRVAYSVLRHRQDAEDVAQEAFAKAHRSFRQLRDRGRFRAWLVRMTWRLAMDRQRADRRRTRWEQAAVTVVDARRADLVRSALISVEDDAVARERISYLWRAIDELPPKLRLVIVLAAIEGHDVREVAALLGLPEGTVKSRLFLARRTEDPSWSTWERARTPSCTWACRYPCR